MKTTRQQRLKVTGWIIPLGYAIVSLILGMAVPRLEHRYLPDLVTTMSAPSAVAICSSISSGMIALTGIVFSLTFVMVQFSATAYSPRLVLWVARDPVMSHALGIFIATFLYSLMLIGWVDRGDTGRVPLVSGWMVLALLIASMGMFVALIERVGSLQVNRMLVFTGDQGRLAIGQLYPSSEPETEMVETTTHRHLAVSQLLVYRGRPKVIQEVDIASLTRLASNAGAVMEMTTSVGDTAIEPMPLLRVYGARRPIDEQAIWDAILLGDERTFEQDPKYAIRLVVDIAIKALSPAINDPTTAVQALDQIEDLLLRLGLRNLDIGTSRDAGGELRFIAPFPTWDDLLLLALDEIWTYGGGSMQVMRRINSLIRNLITVLPSARQSALSHWEQRIEGSVFRTFIDPEARRDAMVEDHQGLGASRNPPF